MKRAGRAFIQFLFLWSAVKGLLEIPSAIHVGVCMPFPRYFEEAMLHGCSDDSDAESLCECTGISMRELIDEYNEITCKVLSESYGQFRGDAELAGEISVFLAHAHNYTADKDSSYDISRGMDSGIWESPSMLLGDHFAPSKGRLPPASNEEAVFLATYDEVIAIIVQVVRILAAVQGGEDLPASSERYELLKKDILRYRTSFQFEWHPRPRSFCP